jgi:integrase
MRDGTVYQRHLKTCPADDGGGRPPHRCRGPWALVVDGPRGLDGRRRQVTRSGFASRAAALAALDEERDRLQGSEPGAGRVKVSDYLASWLAGKRNLRPSSVALYRGHIERHLAPALGHLRLSELRAEHVDHFLNELLADAGVSAATSRRIHATLRAALNGAVRRRLIPYNPALQVELPAERRAPSPVWTPEQVGHFLDVTQHDRLGPLWALVVMTGVRRGEAVGLQWGDVDLDAGVIRVRQQAVEVAGRVHLSEPKTRSGVRTVPLDSGTTAALRSHKAAQAAERLKAGAAWRDTGFVFTDELGQMLRPEAVSRAFRGAAARAELPRIRLHDLRHTSASLALSAGVPLKVVSDRLGHSTIAITANLYTHVSPVVAQGAADAIAGSVPRGRVQ